MFRRPARRAPLCLVSLVFAAVVGCSGQGAGGAPRAVGEHGCELRCREAWQRRQINPSVGDDQFVLSRFGRPVVYAILLEEQSLLENREDFQATIDARLAAMSAQVSKKGAMRFSRQGPIGRAELEFDAKVSGIQLRYALHVQSRDGLTHQAVIWSTRENTSKLRSSGRQLMADLAYPPAGSAWDRGARPRAYKVIVADKELSFQTRPSVMPPSSDDDAALAYHLSHDQQHALIVYDGGEHYSADAMLDSSFEALNAGEADPFRELRRENVRLGGVTVRQLTGVDSSHTLHVLAIPAGPRRFFDVRYVALGKPETPRRDRDLLLRSLTVSDLNAVLALPAIAGEATRRTLEGPEQELFDRAAIVGRFKKSYFSRLRTAPDGRVVGVGGREASLAAPARPDADEQMLYRSADWSPQLDVARWRDKWVAISPENEVVDAATGETITPRIGARLMAAAGERLLIAPPLADESVIGFPDAPRLEDDPIMLVDARGKRQAAATLPGHTAFNLAASADGRLALVDARRRPRVSDVGYGEPTLMLVDLEARRVAPLGDWERIDYLAAADGGWLVTGRPADGVDGVHLMADDGRAALLLAGPEYAGVAARDGRLTFVSTDPPTTDDQTQAVVCDVALDDARRLGPLCHPFSAPTLNRLAAAWLTELDQPSPPAARTAEDIRRLVTAAEAVSQRVVGRPLPETGQGVDDLAAQANGGGPLTPAAQMLTTLLIVDQLLDQGAGWRASGRGAAVDWLSGNLSVDESAFARGYTVTGLLTNLWHDDDGIWRPGERLVDDAEGRPLVLGLDRQAVRQAVGEAALADADAAIDRGEPRAIAALLDAAPANRFFRRRVYQRLAAAERFGVVEQVARPWAERPDAAPADKLADVTAWLAARRQNAATPEDRERLVADLRKAVETHTDEQLLYLLLGSLYEQTEQDDPRFARLCYSRVVELGSWGASAEAANKALARLSEESPEEPEDDAAD